MISQVLLIQKQNILNFYLDNSQEWKLFWKKNLVTTEYLMEFIKEFILLLALELLLEKLEIWLNF